MIKYKYNQKLNILESKVSGTLKINDIENHFIEMSNIDALPNNLKVLIDCTGSHVDLKTSEINISIDVIKNVLKKYNHIQEAIIVDQPFETAISTIFKNKFSANIPNLSFKIFSTKNAAMIWLG